MGIWMLKKKPPKIDEHDQPTEPVPHDLFPGPASFPPAYPTSSGYDTIPAPHATNHTFYPVPPATATGADLSQPGGQEGMPVSMGWGQRLSQSISTLSLRLLPLEVGLCFVGIQILLLVRFVCKAWNLAPDGGWVGTVYQISDMALLPVQMLLPPLHQAFFTRIEPYTLLAIVLYGFCSRILVHILKMIIYAHIGIDRATSQGSNVRKTVDRAN